MWHVIQCERCGAKLRYNDSSTWLGNRDWEEVVCPKCHHENGKVFIDYAPVVYVVEEETELSE